MKHDNAVRPRRGWKKALIALGIVLGLYAVFLLVSNFNLTPRREYVYFESLRVRDDTIRLDSWIIKGAEPMFLDRGTDKAVLLLHGMGGTPVEMRDLAQYLAGKNITVLVPLLSHHGRQYRDIARMDRDELYNEALRYVHLLQKYFAKVYVGGLSTGGSLSLKIGELEDIDGIISLASPITYGFDFLGGSTLYFLKFFSLITPSMRRIEYGLANDPRVAETLPSFDRLPVNVVLEGEYLKNEVKKHLDRITEPILILQSITDNRAAPGSAQYIYDHVSSARKELLWLHNSGHVITMDYDADIVFRTIRDFIESD
jgi:carboxylesterase